MLLDKAFAERTPPYNQPPVIVLQRTRKNLTRACRELIKAKKSIDDARKEAVRRLSEPIRAFEAQPAILPAEPQPNPVPDAPDKVMSVLLTYAPANDQSIRAALEQLKKLCSSFSVRTR